MTFESIFRDLPSLPWRNGTMQKTPGSGIGMQSWQVSHRQEMMSESARVWRCLFYLSFIQRLLFELALIGAQTCCRGSCRLPEDDEGLCGPLLFMIQTTATVSAVTRKESACGSAVVS